MQRGVLYDVSSYCESLYIMSSDGYKISRRDEAVGTIKKYLKKILFILANQAGILPSVLHLHF